MVGCELQQFPVEKEYVKNKDIKPEDVKELRQWLQTQPHLPAEHITDLDLILAYHCCGRSTGTTKQVLDLHYTLNTLFACYFKDRKLDSNIREALNNVLMTFLPTLTNDGDTVMFIRMINVDPKVFDFGLWIKLVFLLIDLKQYVEGTFKGLVLVVDFGVVSLRHITKIDITNLRQLLYYLQEALFLNLKGMHFINSPSFIDRLIVMMKPFMKKELLDSFQIHTAGTKTIEKLVPISAFPKECGGDYKSIEEIKAETIKFVEAAGDFFEKDNKKTVNEALRPGRAKTISDIFQGVEGSFKKLDID
ncbi:alpha-tocopherol transfer protein-like [Aricia agestis]|uniref:alpha-tocopherol transfer protein-like n=1 Tax=Aricia agestis TaxID=91739 RepID=UPI001C2079A9|nr:alpha-tocopherol transfer protein-like [Aricia agestis]